MAFFLQAENFNRKGPVKDSMKNKRIENMNEFTQTNMDKGITDSATEAPVSDYSKTCLKRPLKIDKTKLLIQNANTFDLH